MGRTTASAIEQALWDIHAASLGVLLYRQLGGDNGGAYGEALPMYANINRATTDRTPADFTTLAKRATAEGFRAIKLASFDESSGSCLRRTGASVAWQPGIERPTAVRNAVGPSIQLSVDCHSHFDGAEAKRVAAKIEPLDLMWLKEPIPWQRSISLARVRGAAAMPIAACEDLSSLEETGPPLTTEAIDALIPNVKHYGDVGELRAIAAAAHMTRTLVAPHNPIGLMATLATGHAMSGVTNFQILEYAYGEASWRVQLFDSSKLIYDGELLLAGRPGLGHRLSADVVSGHRR